MLVCGCGAAIPVWDVQFVVSGNGCCPVAVGRCRACGAIVRAALPEPGDVRGEIARAVADVVQAAERVRAKL